MDTLSNEKNVGKSKYSKATTKSITSDQKFALNDLIHQAEALTKFVIGKKVINNSRTPSSLHAESTPHKEQKKKQKGNKVDWMPILAEKEENVEIIKFDEFLKAKFEFRIPNIIFDFFK